MIDLYHDLPLTAQDALLTFLLLLPGALIAVLLVRGFTPWSLVRALMRRNIGLNMVFTLLIAISAGLGVGLIAQERGLRAASASATDRFDLVVGAPGSEVTLLLASVYLQPADIALIDGQSYDAIQSHPNVRLAAPLAFGDSYAGHMIVGTTTAFVAHLSPDLSDGRPFASQIEAVVGSAVDLKLGHIFEPAHGHGSGAAADAHVGAEIAITGRMKPTGTPWDDAILVPVESVWAVHGLATGHPPARDGALGPPFDPDWFPGTPAAVVIPDNLYAAYALREAFTTADSMAILPGAVLSQLHGLMGDVRGAMSILTLTSQVIVAIAVLCGLALLVRLFARTLALLRAMGAPARFVLATVWLYAAGLIVGGALIGLLLGALMAAGLSTYLAERTGLAISAVPGWAELHLMAGFVSLALVAALAIASIALRRDPITILRGA